VKIVAESLARISVSSRACFSLHSSILADEFGQFYGRDYGAKNSIKRMNAEQRGSIAAILGRHPISQETLFIAAVARAYCLLLRHYSLHYPTSASHEGATLLDNRIPADDK